MLCVKDQIPRHLDPGQKAALQALSRQVVAQLELRNHTKEILKSRHFLRATLDALSAHIAILDEDGTIIEVNGAWNRFAEENHLPGAKRRGLGDNYLHLCDGAIGPCAEEAAPMAAGIRAVVAGQTDCFELEYPCHSPQQKRWFIARVTRFHSNGQLRVVVAHENSSRPEKGGSGSTG